MHRHFDTTHADAQRRLALPARFNRLVWCDTVGPAPLGNNQRKDCQAGAWQTLPASAVQGRQPQGRRTMRHHGFLEYRRYRYLKLAVVVSVLSLATYRWHRSHHFDAPGGLGYGGSPMGYALGSVAALLIFWLLLLGVRKRRYGSSPTTLQGWLSAHVYLGLALVVVATLHTGLELGLNVHTLAYVLMLGVVLSGMYGVGMYLHLPASITEVMGEDSVQTLTLQIRELDQHARRIALLLPDDYNSLVLDAAERTRLRGTVFDHVSLNTSWRCPTALAVHRMRLLNPKLHGDQAKLGRELIALMLTRSAAVLRIRQHYRLMGRLRLWLLLHVPLSLALLFALLAHLVSVFIYW